MSQSSVTGRSANSSNVFFSLQFFFYSLGAHIAGQAAKQLKSAGKIGVIFGLDPSGIGFDYDKPDTRLGMSDAEYVQVIHTDGDKFGMIQPIGDCNSISFDFLFT